MSQATLLPEQIVTSIVNIGNMERTERMKIADDIKTQIGEYAREVSITAIILSDNYMKELYKVSQSGYIFCIDLLQTWAAQFVQKYAHVEEWEEFIYSDANIYKGTMCWDDFVIAFGEEKMKEFKR